MPRAKRPCATPGCPIIVTSGYCPTHARPKERTPRASASARGYDSRWDKARRSYLRSHPLCVQCKQENKIRVANTVDHIIPHRGNQALFWDTDNWQPMCVRCHSRKTNAEDGGYGNRRVSHTDKPRL